MTAAAQRLAAIDALPAAQLCDATETALNALAAVMNEETMLLRAGRYKEAAPLGATKAQLAQDYVTLARAVQRHADRLGREVPQAVQRLRNGHELLATQMAENLRVLATARSVTESLLTDVATAVGRNTRTTTYGSSGRVNASPAPAQRGLSLNRAL